MDTIWCHPFSTLFFFTTKDLWWKMFFSQPQLAPGPQWVSKHLLQTGWRRAFLKLFSPSWLTEKLFYLWKSFPVLFLPLGSPGLSSALPVLSSSEWFTSCTFIMSVLGKCREHSLFPHAVVSALGFRVIVSETIISTCSRRSGRTQLLQAGGLLLAPSTGPTKKAAGWNQSEISHHKCTSQDGTISRGKMKNSVPFEMSFFLKARMMGISLVFKHAKGRSFLSFFFF